MIRVITGTAKGKKLKVPKAGTRPLTDRIKTSLFDLITDFIPNATVLDLYSGSGAFGIEALSRGAKKAFFVDLSKESVNCIKDNLISTGLDDKGMVINNRINDFITSTSNIYNIIFLDPPFEESIDPDFSQLSKILNKKGILIYRVKKGRNVDIPKTLLNQIYYKKYGKSEIYFFKFKNK